MTSFGVPKWASKTFLVRVISFTTILYGADQLLKIAAQLYLQKPFVFISGLVALRYEQNTGIAWSIPVPQTITLILNIVLLVVLPIFLVKTLKMEEKVNQVILSFLLAGALGNLTDRLVRGYVIDYLALGSFPVFNLADALITLSVFLILVFYDKIIRNIRKPA